MTAYNKLAPQASHFKRIYLKTDKKREVFIEVCLETGSISTAAYFVTVYIELLRGIRNAKELGFKANMTNSASLYHLKRLSVYGFVTRIGRCKWQMEEKSKQI